MTPELHSLHNPDEFKSLNKKPAPTPTVEQVRESVQHGVDTIVKPFIERVKAQRRIPNADKIIVR